MIPGAVIEEILRGPIAGVSPVALWTAAAGIVWTIAGVLLLIWGWLLLPLGRSSHTGHGPFSARSVRVGLAALIAGGASVLGTILLGQGGAFVALESTGLGRIFGTNNPVVATVVGAIDTVGLGFARMGTSIASGFVILGHATSFGAGFEGQYVVANWAAIVLALLVGALAGWVSFSSRWKYAGVATYIGLDLMALGFVALSLAVVEASTNPVAAALGLWLIGVMLFGFFLFLIYQFYALEHIAGAAHASERTEAVGALPDPAPFVLVQVASYNEPCDVVKECLRSTLALDYPADRFAVQLCDDSTDPDVVREMEAFCREVGVDFQHRTNRRGFKGGALNDGLLASPHEVDLIAIVDSDYIIQPGFLRRLVPEFGPPRLAFVQTPQAYRNVRDGALTRWYELADAYFYRVVQPVRARYQSLIFCGTMGLLRRSALADAGGWSEECVTEDAELTIRLLARRWTGKYIPEEYGAGLAPDLMSAVRSQQRRWAFGGVQMLKINKKLLASPQHLTFRQRWDFRLTGLFWFDGLFLVGVTAALAGLVAASWFGIWLPFAAIPAPAIVAVVPALLMLDGLVKIRAALRHVRKVTFRDVLGVLTFWYAIKINDLRAALRAWAGRTMPFVRTPKVSVRDPGRWEAFKAAVRSSTLETTVAVGLVGMTVASLAIWMAPGAIVVTAYYVFLAWLLYYAYAFGSAVWFDYQSRLSLFQTLPPDVPTAVTKGTAEPAAS
jgi:cellulose synthase/poly-beta-1,6-N-acetylglucosamine synthase-like glycosyltransferase